MGGSRTKKGTRKGKQQLKKSTVVSCYKQSNTFGKDFDSKVYYKETNMKEKYFTHFTQMLSSRGDLLDSQSPTGNELLIQLTRLFSCLVLKDYTESRKLCNDECCIELRDSPLGGKGVFATKDIDVGTICTMYPPNYLRNIGRLGLGSCLDSSTGKCLKSQDEADVMSDRLIDYKMGEDLGITLFGDPEFNDEWSFLGHMINDKSYDKTFDYKWDKANVLYIKTGHIVSYIPIKKGEELSLHYDVGYWFKGGVKYPDSRHVAHIS